MIPISGNIDLNILNFRVALMLHHLRPAHIDENGKKIEAQKYISSAYDSAITADTCKAVLKDLKPSGPRERDAGNNKIAPYKVYIANKIIEDHEKFHVRETEQLVHIPLFEATRQKTLELKTKYASDCGTPNPYLELRDWYDKKYFELLYKYHGGKGKFDHEKRVYPIEAIDLRKLRNEIKTRAALPENNWRGCK